MTLVSTPQLREFLDHPEGRYLAGKTWLVFCSTRDLTGFVLWGEPDEHDAHGLVAALPLEGSKLATKLPRFIDVRRLGAIAPAAFKTFVDHFALHAPRHGELVARAAVVHDGAMTLALVAGFSTLADTPYELQWFVEPSEALAWLGVRDPQTLAGELDVAQADAAGTAPILRDLRAYLKEHLSDSTIGRAATALGMSSRSLQRRLRDHETSFQGELRSVRVTVAKLMLAGTDESIAAIASRVGCSSTQHFGKLFRSMVGETPARWRDRMRDKTRNARA